MPLSPKLTLFFPEPAPPAPSMPPLLIISLSSSSTAGDRLNGFHAEPSSSILRYHGGGLFSHTGFCRTPFLLARVIGRFRTGTLRGAVGNTLIRKASEFSSAGRFNEYDESVFFVGVEGVAASFFFAGVEIAAPRSLLRRFRAVLNRRRQNASEISMKNSNESRMI